MNFYKNYVLPILFFIVMPGGSILFGYWLYKKVKPNKVLVFDPHKPRRYCKQTFVFDPEIGSHYSEKQSIAKLKGLYDTNLKYGHIIDSVSYMVDIDRSLLLAVIYEESRGKQTAIGSQNERGLMQIKKATAGNMLYLCKRRGLLNDFTLRLLLYKHLSSERLYTLITAKHCGDVNNLFTYDELHKPELNILIGALYLKLLMTENDNSLEKTLYYYNQGYFAPNFSAFSQLNLQVKIYIRKITGINGVLYLLKNNNFYND